MSRIISRFLALAAATCLAAPASALSLSGDVVQIAPPPSAAHMQLENNTAASFWVEQTGLVVGTPTAVTVIPFQNNPGGFYDSGVAAVEATWAGNLGPGTYDSFFLHGDKDGANQTFQGSITFDNPIVALVHKQNELVTTDAIFGAPGTTYGGGGSGRIYELDGPNNWFSLSADALTLEFKMVVAHNMDDLRIITGVPEPRLALLGLAGLLGLALAGRRRNGAGGRRA